MEYYLRQKNKSINLQDELTQELFLLSACAPFERVKTILQAQRSHPSLKSAQIFLNPFSVASTIYTKQGFAGFWRGNLIPFLSYPPIHLLSLFLNHTKSRFTLFDAEKHRFLNGVEELAKCVLMAGLWGAIVFPIQTMKTQLNLDLGSGPAKEFKGLKQCFEKVSTRPQEMYRGLATTTVVPMLATNWAYQQSYYWSDEALRSMTNFMNVVTLYSISYLFNLAAILPLYPFETVRFRLLLQAGREKQLYKGPLDCATQIFVNEGWIGFYRGFSVMSFQLLIGMIYVNWYYSFGAMN
jgi:hypothetical protein